MDANVLQQHKENIAPLPSGRPASKLGKALGEVRTRTSLAAQRELFEAKLLLDELDDPLQEHVSYIEWIHNHYPQGSNAESGLLPVLERCTSFFRDAEHYKNDPRYLKVWLEYAAYSDAPRDVFVYLAKKKIACELALYYEEFAKFLEVRHAYDDAREVYEVGISRKARPFSRLERSFVAFSARMAKILHTSREPRQVLGKRPADRDLSGLGIGAVGRKKVAVYGDSAPVSLKDEVFKSDNDAQLASLGAAKENKIAAKPWAGEVLKQNVPEKSASKFTVFRDVEKRNDGFEVVERDGKQYTVIRNPGKAPERLAVNLNLLYAPEEEVCLAELLGKLSSEAGNVGKAKVGGERRDTAEKEGREERVERRWRDMDLARGKEKVLVKRDWEGEGVDASGKERKERGLVEREWKTHNSETLAREDDHTFTIPLKDDSRHNPKSPTMTLFSRLTTNEVLGMFNDAAHNFQLDDEKATEDSTNYEGFVTETIPHVTTPPTDGSLPFVP